MRNKASLGADEHFKFPSFVLSVFDRTMHILVALISDNVATNRVLACKARPLHIGYLSHQFVLATQNIILEQKGVIKKV